MLCTIMLVSAMHIPLCEAHSLMSPDRCVQWRNQCYSLDNQGHSAPRRHPHRPLHSWHSPAPTPGTCRSYFWPALSPFLASHTHWGCGLSCLAASPSHSDRSLSVRRLHSTPVTPSQHFLLKKPDHLFPQVSHGLDFTDCIPLGVASEKPQRSSFSSMTFV